MGDFAVIDVSEEYGVAKRPAGEEEALIADVIAIFRGKIGEEVWAAHRERFVFAVAVHSIECWLLPPLFPDHKAGKRAKTVGCLDAADHELKVGGAPRLRKGDGKDPNGYLAAARVYRRWRELMRHQAANPSLRVFVDALAACSLPT